MEKIDPKNVPVLILAGGLGTRFAEETSAKPKPMIEIGGHPILLHIMRYYYSFGFDDFVICAGHLSWMIKDYFAKYDLQHNHIEIDHRSSLESRPKVFGHKSKAQERWRVRVLETGLEAMTGARIARALDCITEEDGSAPEHFAVTYGDGLCDVNLRTEFNYHLENNKIGTVLGIKPTARFGELDIKDNGLVEGFLEKPESKQGFINGGYFFFRRQFRKYLETENSCILERSPLQKLAADEQLMMFSHSGFWQCMDNLRDKINLQNAWESERCPWRKW